MYTFRLPESFLIGTAHRFGLTWVDHETGRRRWKKSRYYFQRVCQTKTVD